MVLTNQVDRVANYPSCSIEHLTSTDSNRDLGPLPANLNDLVSFLCGTDTMESYTY